MKPSDLRRDAYTWAGIASSAKDRGHALRDSDSQQGRYAAAHFNLAAQHIEKAVEAMTNAADELEARNAS